MREKEKPGFMLYHADCEAMSCLDAETYKSVIIALWRFSEFGEQPEELNGAAEFAFKLMREKMLRDSERYTQRVEAGRTGGRKSAARRRALRETGKGQAQNAETESTEAEVLLHEAENKQSQAKASKSKQNQPTVNSTSTVNSTVNSTVDSTVNSASSSQEPQIMISDGKEEEEFPPTREMILSYAREKGVEIDADDFLSRCREAGWKDGEGKPVRNWRLWLKGYLVRQATESVRRRTSPDPRIMELERLKRKYISEEAAENE